MSRNGHFEMKEMKWGKFAELIGAVSIVAGLILVAWEIHQANNIAKAQVVLELAAQANEFNSATFENPEVAELSRAMSDPDHIDSSETQKSMMTGVAWHFTNIFWSAQRAYDNGLLGDDDIQNYQASVAWHIDNHPGLKPAFMVVYDTAPWVRDMYVFQPLVEMVCESRNNCAEISADK
jgi:hypothetical protein